MLVLIAHLQTWVGDRLDRDRGATAVEYGLMVGLIAIAVIGVVATFGEELAGLFTGVTDQLPGTTPAP
ncbi:Flp family type IVb pilin [Lentzea tibetensis]|uniref:Flp family type IVb pilin n=1 Tax=Lentzea tibetensis TaxID=2591470 RepID=A0A563EY31_9PSEU|nr:Flp family type IVb pilin [Lentzea tibetensis]TWP52391.1 Flp family type IVb pilin [Lentzea tibetensis]